MRWGEHKSKAVCDTAAKNIVGETDSLVLRSSDSLSIGSHTAKLLGVYH